MTCEALTFIAEKKEDSPASTKDLKSFLELSAPFSARRASRDCNHGVRNKDARDTWVKRIDILKARYTARLPFAQTELEELGLERIRLRTSELVSVSIEPRTEKTQ